MTIEKPARLFCFGMRHPNGESKSGKVLRWRFRLLSRSSSMLHVAWLPRAPKSWSCRPAYGRNSLRLEPLESRLLLNAGELDVVFNNTGRAMTDFGFGNDAIHAMAVQPDSKIITAGESGFGDWQFTVARY